MNADELTTLWIEHQDYFAKRLYRIIGDSPDIQDLLHDSFLKLYPKAHRIQPEYVVQYCTLTVANTARDYLRRKRRTPPLIEIPDGLASAPNQVEALYTAEREALYQTRLVPALKALGKDQREAVEHLLTEESQIQAARDIGIPPTTFRSRQRAGLRLLADKLKVN